MGHSVMTVFIDFRKRISKFWLMYYFFRKYENNAQYSSNEKDDIQGWGPS
jgi:hypothetical protein